MRIAKFFTVVSILLLLFAYSASAQRKKPRKPAPKPTPTKLSINPVVSVAKQQVSNQLHNVNVFVDKMGPIAIAIESADKEAIARRLGKDAIAANEANKKKIIAAIRGLRDGLVALETDFKTKPQLTQYLSKIQGISALCAQSEDNAIAGRFVASKDPLRQIALKLNETLAVLPGPLTANSPVAANINRPVAYQSEQVSSNKTSSNSTAKRNVVLGMTTSEVLESVWGAPTKKRTSTSPNGTTEVWLYSGNRSLYFFNGKLTTIVP